jgi:phosphoheptose isomerase
MANSQFDSLVGSQVRKSKPDDVFIPIYTNGNSPSISAVVAKELDIGLTVLTDASGGQLKGVV